MRAGRAVAIVVIAGAVAAGAAGSWCLSIPEVRIGSPSMGPAVEAVYATGVVEPVTWAKVTPMIRGRIVDLCACEGEEKARDEVLARLDDAEQRARLAELEARAKFLAKDVERYRRLLESRNVSAQAYERVASNYDEVRAAVAVERERLADFELCAPIDGVVLRRDGEVGEIAEPGDVLFWVGRPRPMEVEAEVDEEDIPQVRIGQRALIKADAFPGDVLAGAVHHITPKGDPINKNYRVRVALSDDTPLMIGMTTEINVVIREVPETLLVPADAVMDGAVWVFADGRVRRRAVETGVVGSQRIEVTSGLALSDTVVVAPPEGLKDGGRVRLAAED